MSAALPFVYYFQINAVIYLRVILTVSYWWRYQNVIVC